MTVRPIFFSSPMFGAIDHASAEAEDDKRRTEIRERMAQRVHAMLDHTAKDHGGR